MRSSALNRVAGTGHAATPVPVRRGSRNQISPATSPCFPEECAGRHRGKRSTRAFGGGRDSNPHSCVTVLATKTDTEPPGRFNSYLVSVFRFVFPGLSASVFTIAQCDPESTDAFSIRYLETKRVSKAATRALRLRCEIVLFSRISALGVHGVAGFLSIILSGVFALTAGNSDGTDGLLLGGGDFFFGKQCDVTVARADARAQERDHDEELGGRIRRGGGRAHRR
jgi:hypothetical protein